MAASKQPRKVSIQRQELPRPGDLVPGKGVYFGVWSPKDRGGKSLGKTFNVYAAPYDLGERKGCDRYTGGAQLLLEHNAAVKAVGSIRSLMGHKGGKYKNDAELYEALRKGTYKGEWFIPTCDLMNGKDVDGKKVQNDNLYQYRDTGAFDWTFTTWRDGGRVHSWYRSCTELRKLPAFFKEVDFSSGKAGASFPGWDRPLRLVRAEPVP